MKRVLKSLVGLGLAAVFGASPAVGQTISQAESAQFYGSARGWNVYSVGDGRGLFACRAVRGRGYMDELAFEFDVFSSEWKLLVQASRESGGGPGTQGAIVSFGGQGHDRQFFHGYEGDDGASNTHTGMYLEGADFDRFRSGSSMRVEVNGERSRSWSLSGTTAASSKVAECVTNMMGHAPTGLRIGAQPVPAPQSVPTNRTARVDGNSIGYVRYPGGQFRATGGGNWVEEGDNGSVFYFTEVERHADGVALNDGSRNLQIVIDLPANSVSWTSDFNLDALQYLYGIDCYDRQAGRSC